MGWPVWSLCQIAVVRARMRCRTLTITPAGVWQGSGVFRDCPVVS